MSLSTKQRDELCELTSVPTASGCEGQIVAWVRRWVERRKGLTLRRDRFGNLMIESERLGRQRNPLIFEAHMDHPAFVVSEIRSDTQVLAEFRGGVHEAFFEGSPVRLWADDQAVQTGRVRTLHQAKVNQPDKRVTIDLDRPTRAQVGQPITWLLPSSSIKGERLRAPVCDNLVGVMAALHAFDHVRQSARRTIHPTDVRVVLTRCEEIGFIGSTGACQSGLVPKNGRIIVLENSKRFADSPIGGGPIVRVGDATSTFDPELTYRLGQIAGDLSRHDKTFTYQRRLMPGGTCEATAYHAFGRSTSCLCLALGNYHNMNQRTGRIDRETISIADYDALVRLLGQIARRIDEADASKLASRLTERFNQRRHLLEV